MNLRGLLTRIGAHGLELLAALGAVIGIWLAVRDQQLTSLLGISISFIALVISVRDGRQSRRASAKANDEYKQALGLVENYTELVKEFRGQILDWKELIHELAKQVAAESESIMLAIDILTYGAVTMPEAHRTFWAALLSRVAMRVPVQIVTYNEAAVTQMIKEEFGQEMASSPTGDVALEIADHFDYIDVLRRQGGATVNIVLSNYFPLHLFIFKGNGTAMLALQELSGDGVVRARAILTHDPTMIDICRQSFLKMQAMALETTLGD